MCVSLLLLCFGTKRDSHFHVFKEEGLRMRRAPPPRTISSSPGDDLQQAAWRLNLRLFPKITPKTSLRWKVREGNARTNTPPCLFEDTCWAARLISSSFSRLSGLRGADYKEELIPLALLISLIRAPGR